VPAAVKPVKPVRLNLDIDRETHRWLKSFALQADDGLADKLRTRLSD